MNRHANEDRLCDRLDRNRDKAANTARTLQVRANAREAVNALVMAANEEDRPVTMQEAINHLATLYTASQGPAATGSLYSKLSKAPVIGLNRAILNARAEQVFARAANDGEAE